MFKLKNILYTLIFSLTILFFILLFIFLPDFLLNTKKGSDDLGITYLIFFFFFYISSSIFIFIEIQKVNRDYLIKNFICIIISLFVSLLPLFISWDIYYVKNTEWWNEGLSYIIKQDKSHIVTYFWFWTRIIIYSLFQFYVFSLIANFLLYITIKDEQKYEFINKNIWYLISNRINYKFIEENQILLTKKNYIFCVNIINSLSGIDIIQFKEDVKVIEEKINVLDFDDKSQIDKVKTRIIEEDNFIKRLKRTKKYHNQSGKNYIDIILIDDEHKLEILGNKDIDIAVHEISKFKYWNKKFLKDEVEIE